MKLHRHSPNNAFLFHVFFFLSVCYSSVIRSVQIICVFIQNIIFPPVLYQLHCSLKGKYALSFAWL